MRILYVAPRFHTNQHAITKYLVEQGHEVMFLVARKEITEDYSYVSPMLCEPSRLYERVEKKKYPEPSVAQEDFRIGHFIPSSKWMTKIIKEFPPDIMITRERTLFSLVAIRCARKCGVKCRILYTQSPLFRPKRSIIKNLYVGIYDILAPVKAFITPCEQMVAGQDKSRLIKNKKWEFIPLVTEEKQFVEGRDYLKDGYINIIDIGKYRPYKNHFVLVNAISLLSEEELAKMKVTILGQSVKEEEEAYFNELSIYVKEKKLENVITIRKNTPYKEMANEYLRNDVFVLTSKNERCAVTITEALSYGLLSISTDHNGSSSYIKENETGYIFKTNDAESLSKILKEICNHPESIPCMGRQAYMSYLSKFTPEQYWTKIMRIYNK